MIQVQELYKRFGKVEVLKGLSLELPQKGVTAVLGPNGSGKTTLIKSILGMVVPDKGEVFMNGKNVRGEYQYRKSIDYLPQIADFPNNLQVGELIHMIGDIRGNKARVEGLITEFGLEEYRKKKLGHLSGGTKQKVNIVLAFMGDSPLLILDEPTTGLDPISLLKLKKMIRQEKEKGKIILITSHIMDFVDQMADHVVFILDGKIHFKGSLSMLKEQTSQERLEQAIAHLLIKAHA